MQYLAAELEESLFEIVPDWRPRYLLTITTFKGDNQVQVFFLWAGLEKLVHTANKDCLAYVLEIIIITTPLTSSPSK